MAEKITLLQTLPPIAQKSVTTENPTLSSERATMPETEVLTSISVPETEVLTSTSVPETEVLTSTSVPEKEQLPKEVSISILQNVTYYSFFVPMLMCAALGFILIRRAISARRADTAQASGVLGAIIAIMACGIFIQSHNYAASLHSWENQGILLLRNPLWILLSLSSVLLLSKFHGFTKGFKLHSTWAILIATAFLLLEPGGHPSISPGLRHLFNASAIAFSLAALAMMLSSAKEHIDAANTAIKFIAVLLLLPPIVSLITGVTDNAAATYLTMNLTDAVTVTLLSIPFLREPVLIPRTALRPARSLID